MRSSDPSLVSRGVRLQVEQAAHAARGAGMSLWVLYVIVWAFLGLVTAVTLRLGVPWQIPAMVMAPMTLVGIAWRPLFGLCLMAALAPIGLGLAVGGVFSAERAVGILFALGALLNMLITRRGFRFQNVNVLVLLGLVLLSLLSTLWSLYPRQSATLTFTLFQMLVYIILVVAVCRTRDDLLWPLRSFVVASVLTVILLKVTGGGATMGPRATVELTPERAINPGRLSAILGLALFAAIYLYRRDPIRRLRWL